LGALEPWALLDHPHHHRAGRAPGAARPLSLPASPELSRGGGRDRDAPPRFRRLGGGRGVLRAQCGPAGLADRLGRPGACAPTPSLAHHPLPSLREGPEAFFGFRIRTPALMPAPSHPLPSGATIAGSAVETAARPGTTGGFAGVLGRIGTVGAMLSQ